jgi:hypothetical protein
MGLGNYFKSKKQEPVAEILEKPTPESPKPSYNMELQPPQSRFGSSRNSVSNMSTRSSTFLDDIKHEVMVNYLYQQQCANLWVSDGSGEIEGVLIRKSRNTYMACPPQLGSSAFAAACAALNVQVRFDDLPDAERILIPPVCDDRKLPGYQNISPVVP